MTTARAVTTAAAAFAHVRPQKRFAGVADSPLEQKQQQRRHSVVPSRFVQSLFNGPAISPHNRDKLPLSVFGTAVPKRKVRVKSFCFEWNRRTRRKSRTSREDGSALRRWQRFCMTAHSGGGASVVGHRSCPFFVRQQQQQQLSRVEKVYLISLSSTIHVVEALHLRCH